MVKVANAAALLARGQQPAGSRATKEVPIGNLGVVIVRGLTTKELRQSVDKDGKPSDMAMIATALVQPTMTPEEVEDWLSGAPAGDMVKVSRAVLSLSGMEPDAIKSGVLGL